MVTPVVSTEAILVSAISLSSEVLPMPIVSSIEAVVVTDTLFPWELPEYEVRPAHLEHYAVLLQKASVAIRSMQQRNI